MNKKTLEEKLEEIYENAFQNAMEIMDEPNEEDAHAQAEWVVQEEIERLRKVSQDDSK